jgi:N-acetylglucosaminyldiphosphoundecaprenol N-acetyl-beta-D-mannosaminyltransferase
VGEKKEEFLREKGFLIPLSEIRLLGIKVNPLRSGELTELIGDIIRRGRKELVLNVNVNAVNLAVKNRWMKDLLNSAAVVFCDGYGVMLGARMLGERIPERITYADWLWELSHYAQDEGFSYFFLGGVEGVAEQAAERLKEKYPRLKIAGIMHGYFEKEGSENDGVIQKINASSPDILVVGFGMPAQERWLRDNWKKINAHVALTGGACFDFLSGRVKRAPRWMSDHGLEWLYRLALEPRRMFVRYVIGNPLFLLRVLRERIQKKRPQSPAKKTMEGKDE